MQLKYSLLRDQNLTNALRKLGNHPKFAPKFAMSISKMIDGIFDQEVIVHKEYTQLIDKHAKKNEKGEYIPREDPNGKKMPGTFVASDSDKWDEDHIAFGEKTFRVSASPIPLKILEGVGLTPLELKAMEPLVTELDLA